MSGKFKLKNKQNSKYHFNLTAGNGQIILTSEVYESKASALNGIESVKTNCSDDNRFERKENKGGKPFFVLKAKNGQIIGQSQFYNSKKAMENGILSVRNNAPTAETIEL